MSPKIKRGKNEWMKEWRSWGRWGGGGAERVEIKQEGNAPSFHFVGAKITSWIRIRCFKYGNSDRVAQRCQVLPISRKYVRDKKGNSYLPSIPTSSSPTLLPRPFHPLSLYERWEFQKFIQRSLSKRFASVTAHVAAPFNIWRPTISSACSKLLPDSSNPVSARLFSWQMMNGVTIVSQSAAWNTGPI